MMRVHLEAQKRCYNHPHRVTALTCERCRTSLCEACLSERDGARLCANCFRELEAAEAARLTPKQRAILSLRSLTGGLVVFLVIAAVVGGIFFAFRGIFDRPITPEEMARFRYGLTGSFETEEGVNVCSTVLGAKVVGATSEAAGYPAKQLINEFTGEGIPPWRSADASLPQEVVVELQDRSAIQKVILTNNPAEPPETYVKEFEVLVSSDGPDRGFVSVGRFEMAPNADPQRFEFPVVTGRWVMLRILGNGGSREHTSLDEFGAFLYPSNPLRQGAGMPTARP